MDEFRLIREFFQRSPRAEAVRLGIGDDGAVVSPQAGFDHVHVIDTLVAGTHFPDATAAADIAYRCVAVNASDIAAMGAKPLHMTLALTMKEADEKWLQHFANGLFDCADDFSIDLIGGDTTRGQQTVVTIAMTGLVEVGQALQRNGARIGDAIYVSGTLGDAAAGLRELQGESRDSADAFLTSRFLRPSARVELGRSLQGVARAVIDVSDGLLGDLGKLLLASDVGAVLDLECLPLSSAMQSRYSENEQRDFALCGGDDYELCFTAPAAACTQLAGVTRIGEIVEGAGIECRANGRFVPIDDAGYRHFQ